MQLEVSGEDAESFLESQIVADLRGLSINTGIHSRAANTFRILPLGSILFCAVSSYRHVVCADY